MGKNGASEAKKIIGDFLSEMESKDLKELTEQDIEKLHEELKSNMKKMVRLNRILLNIIIESNGKQI